MKEWTVLGVSRLLVLDGLRDRISRRQALAGVLGMAVIALTEDIDAKKKKRKKKNKSKKKDKNHGPAQDTGCPAGQVECDDQCRDLSSDIEHCGECYESCYNGQICSAGVCKVPCSEHACLTTTFNDDFGGYSIATLASGNLAALGGDHQVGIYTSEGRLLRIIGEFGTEEGEFNGPAALAVGPNDDLYVADTDNRRIQLLKASGQIEVIPFDYPNVLAATSAGKIYTGRYSRIERILTTGEVEFTWGPDGTDASEFDYLTDIAIDESGDIYALSTSNGRVYRFSDAGPGETTVKWSIGGIGVDPGEFRSPSALAIAANRVFVADGSGKSARVHVLDAVNGSFLFKFPITDNDGYGLYPEDIAADANGNVYIADWGIYVYTLKS